MKGAIMGKLAWDLPGDRVFEVGVSQGVLYIDNAGVPWNGLTSVTEEASDAEATPYYLDGIKYLELVPNEDFAATIEAFTYPDEFAACEGIKLVANGLYAGLQPRIPFGFSYKVLVGDDSEGTDLGYKIHLVYNALAAPGSKSNRTVGERTDPNTFSWAITARPPQDVGVRPTSHFVIDSRKVPAGLLAIVEDVIYGNVLAQSRLPSVSELLFIFDNYLVDTYDAGLLSSSYYAELDSGYLTEPYTETLDPGGP
jgi:hypothetical protein